MTKATGYTKKTPKLYTVPVRLTVSAGTLHEAKSLVETMLHDAYWELIEESEHQAKHGLTPTGIVAYDLEAARPLIGDKTLGII